MTRNPERLSQAWHQAAEAAIQELRAWPKRTVHVFHHNDADGLCSGAILSRAFEGAGYEVRRFCLEKPYPAVVRKVYERAGEIFVFADFAGRMAPMLSTLNKGRNLTLILDHHVAGEATDPRVFNLDPDLFGLKGDRDISASTTCYRFGVKLDPGTQDLAGIAALGAVGDEFFVEGRLVSENRAVTLEAVQQGLVAIQKQEKGERYFLKVLQGEFPCDALGVYLDTLGGVGYYKGGPQMGVRVCLEGLSPDSDRMVEDLRHTKDQAFDTEIARLRSEGLRHSPHIQWFHVENRFSPMGVKMIGAFCDAIKNMDVVDPDKYVAGFQIIPNEIPGFGTFEFNEVKISMRVSARMEGEIRAGRAVGLDVLLPEATSRVGGFSDACHSLTAATTVGLGKEESLIDEMEKILVR
jgi:single-stranded-DNA-specific exonuclease